MARKKVIAANWKMYKNPEQTKQFFQDFLPMVAGHDRDEIVVCPPYVDLRAALDAAKDLERRHRRPERLLEGRGRIHRRDFFQHASRGRLHARDHRAL